MRKRPNKSQAAPTGKKAKVVHSPNARRRRDKTPERPSSPSRFIRTIKVEVPEHVDELTTSETLMQSQLEETQGLVDEGQNVQESPESEVDLEPDVPKVDTPFGMFKIYGNLEEFDFYNFLGPPNPESFVLEPTSGYYFDPATGFFHDKTTEYYYDSKTKEWLFWTKTFSTYIPRKGGDEALKTALLEQELIEKEAAERKENLEVILLDSDEEMEEDKQVSSKVMIFL